MKSRVHVKDSLADQFYSEAVMHAHQVRSADLALPTGAQSCHEFRFWCSCRYNNRLGNETLQHGPNMLVLIARKACCGRHAGYLSGIIRISGALFGQKLAQNIYLKHLMRLDRCQNASADGPNSVSPCSILPSDGREGSRGKYEQLQSRRLF